MDGDLHFALSRFVLEHHRDFVVVLGRDGRIVDVNRSARGAELDIAMLFDVPERDLRIVAFLEELDLSGHAHTLVASANGTVSRLEGTTVDQFRIVVARELAKNGATVPALGVVAAAFVHDFNNLLAPILLLSGRLERSLEEGTDSAMLAADIHRSASLAAELARDVLALSRPRVAIVERVDVNEMLAELERLIRRLAGPDVDVLFALRDEDVLETRVDRKRLEHAILSLVVAARDAMPDGGKLAISTTLAGGLGARRIAVSLTDTGDEARSRSVDGFSIDIRAAAGKGTSATLLLEPAPPPPPPESSPRRIDGQPERSVIMVAERDALVRGAIQRVLESRGWTVVAVSTQDDALAAAAVHPVAVGMLDGLIFRRAPTTFLHQLRALAPKMRLVLLTDHGLGERAPQHVVVLPKPFGDEELLRAVRDALV